MSKLIISKLQKCIGLRGMCKAPYSIRHKSAVDIASKDTKLGSGNVVEFIFDPISDDRRFWLECDESSFGLDLLIKQEIECGNNALTLSLIGSDKDEFSYPPLTIQVSAINVCSRIVGQSEANSSAAGAVSVQRKAKFHIEVDDIRVGMGESFGSFAKERIKYFELGSEFEELAKVVRTALQDGKKCILTIEQQFE